MSVKSLLVAYNGSTASDAALRLAVLMHKKYQAHVTGLLAHQSAQAKLQEQTWIPAELKSTLGAVEAKEHARIKAAFHRFADPAIAPEALHWIERFGHSDQTVADYSLMYDITVAGRRDLLTGYERYELHPDRIAIRSGRPILVVPREYKVETIHEHAVLAWDGNRSAANALWAAMTILETKQRVTVLTVETRKTGQPLPGIDVVTALSRHGVRADRVRLKPGKHGVAKTILDYCATEGAGLLVMGVSRSRGFREELFGGTGKELIETAPIPILLSQ